MSKLPDRSPEFAPSPTVSAETARGRQRLGMGLISLGLAFGGAGILLAGGVGYLPEYPATLMGSSMIVAGAFGASQVI